MFNLVVSVAIMGLGIGYALTDDGRGSALRTFVAPRSTRLAAATSSVPERAPDTVADPASPAHSGPGTTVVTVTVTTIARTAAGSVTPPPGTQTSAPQPGGATTTTRAPGVEPDGDATTTMVPTSDPPAETTSTTVGQTPSSTVPGTSKPCPTRGGGASCR
jgi:hypothetical protein